MSKSPNVGTFAVSSYISEMPTYMAKGFTRPLINVPHLLSPELFGSQETLYAKLKPARIIRFKSKQDTLIIVSDLFKVYVRMDGAKHGKCSSWQTVLSFNPSSWTMKVPDQNGRKMKAPTEEIRQASPTIAVRC